MLTISASQYAALLNLDFNIGSRTYSLIPKTQIWPRLLNSIFGGDSDIICLVDISVSNLPLMIPHRLAQTFVKTPTSYLGNPPSNVSTVSLTPRMDE